MLTTQEVDQYIRLTLKQWDMSHVRVSWIESQKVNGLAYAGDWRIELASHTLQSFTLFREIFLHELAHLLDYRERGTYVVNKYEMAHGKNWRKWCHILKIPARTKTAA